MLKIKFKIAMRLTDRLGVQILTGTALRNFHKMQLRPKYNRYRTRMKILAEKNPYLKIARLLSFDEFYKLMKIPKKKQSSMFGETLKLN